MAQLRHAAVLLVLALVAQQVQAAGGFGVGWVLRWLRGSGESEVTPEKPRDKPTTALVWSPDKPGLALHEPRSGPAAGAPARLLILLEPFCPASPDYGREAACEDASAGGALAAGCPTSGLDNNWANHPSWSLRVGAAYAGCYSGKPHYKASYTAMFRRAAPALLALGWGSLQVANFGGRASMAALAESDVVLCSSKHYRMLAPLAPCKRYVLVMPDDPATLERGIDYNAPNILAVLQHTSLRPRDENNQLPILPRRLFKGSGHPQSPRHLAWLAKGPGVQMAGRCPQITPASLAKVQPLIPMAVRLRHPLDCGGSTSMLPLQGAFSGEPGWAKPLAQRGIDVMYLGASHARSGMLLEQHRRQAAEAIQALRHKHPSLKVFTGGRLNASEFVETLRDAKVFVSPFGLGEFSGKDYEAALAGCLLAKPLAHKLQSYPNIYDASVALDVRADFSDLEEVVLGVLGDLGSAQVMVDRQRKQLLEHDERRLAADLDALLRRRLASEGSTWAAQESCTPSAPPGPDGVLDPPRKCTAREGARAFRSYRRVGVDGPGCK